MVVFSSRISPRASTSIFLVRSPCATAVVTWAMLRTWPVRLLAIELTLSVRSFQVPATFGTVAWPPRLPVGADLAGDPGDLAGERRQRVDHRVDGLGQGGDLALGLDGDLLAQVARRHRGGDLGDRPDLRGQVRRHDVDVVGQVLPGPGHALHDGLAAELALGAHLAGDPGDLVGEGRQLVDHRVDGLLQLQDLPARVDPDLLAQVALGHRRGDLGDRADLGGEVGRHDVDRLGQVLPGAGHALHVGLAAEPALGADLAGDPGDLAGERRTAGRPSC